MEEACGGLCVSGVRRHNGKSSGSRVQSIFQRKRAGSVHSFFGGEYMKVVGLVLSLAVMASTGFAQSKSGQPTPFSVWSIHAPDTLVEGRSPYSVGALTPLRSIVIRRVEAVSNRGPSKGSLPSGQPIPCPVQYVLELTNGAVTQTVDISNRFLNEKTSQTYTDSGPLSVRFNAENRITVSMIAPKPQFPPVSCTIMGLDIAIQYEPADEATQRTFSSGEDHP